MLSKFPVHVVWVLSIAQPEVSVIMPVDKMSVFISKPKFLCDVLLTKHVWFHIIILKKSEETFNAYLRT